MTAGNASRQNDGAAICVVTSPEKAAELGLRPLVRLVSLVWAGGAGDDGNRAGPATAKALRRGGFDGARIWTGHGVLTRNPVKIAALAG